MYEYVFYWIIMIFNLIFISIFESIKMSILIKFVSHFYRKRCKLFLYSVKMAVQKMRIMKDSVHFEGL